jgi:hypothetical protein
VTTQGNWTFWSLLGYRAALKFVQDPTIPWWRVIASSGEPGYLSFAFIDTKWLCLTVVSSQVKSHIEGMLERVLRGSETPWKRKESSSHQADRFPLGLMDGMGFWMKMKFEIPVCDQFEMLKGEENLWGRSCATLKGVAKAPRHSSTVIPTASLATTAD